MTELKWEEPPHADQRRPGGAKRHAEVAAQLKSRPGEWARVAAFDKDTRSRTYAHYIRRGGLAAYRPDGSFEAVSRTVDGEYRVYARYVGGEGGE
jgi:hypothetical protein